jgi:hypothetical protein
MPPAESEALEFGPRRGVAAHWPKKRQPSNLMQLINSLLFVFPFLDVLLDAALISANCCYEVASGPETMIIEVELASKEICRNEDGPPALDETNDLGKALLGWDGDQHVSAIWHQAAFFDLIPFCWTKSRTN